MEGIHFLVAIRCKPENEAVGFVQFNKGLYISITISIFARNIVTVNVNSIAGMMILMVKGNIKSDAINSNVEPARLNNIVVKILYLILSLKEIGKTLVSQKACPSLVIAVAEILQITAGEIKIPLRIKSI